jgi:hypothetical protein
MRRKFEKDNKVQFFHSEIPFELRYSFLIPLHLSCALQSKPELRLNAYFHFGCNVITYLHMHCFCGGNMRLTTLSSR